MSRYMLIGNSGSGKTTLATRLAREASLPHLDLDTLAWEKTQPPRRRSPSARTSFSSIRGFMKGTVPFVES